MPRDPAPLDPLTRLAIRFGTDKFGGHLYTPAYHHLLGHLREQKLRILEIGVGGYDNPHCGGASLRMWAEYFPQARIIGLDYYEKQIAISPRVSIVRGAQEDTGLLAELNATHGPFDLVIDDGSHQPEHMISSFLYLYPLLTPSAKYIVEDTQTCFMERFGGNSGARGTLYPLAQLLALQMHKGEGYIPAPGETDLSALAAVSFSVTCMRNIICFQRGDNTYPSNIDLDMGDPAVAEVFKTIEHEAAMHPAPRNVLSRIDMQNNARQFAAAAALAQAAMREFPTDLPLMHELLFMMKRMNQAAMISRLEARVAALEAFCVRAALD